MFVTNYNFNKSAGGLDSESDYNGITFKVCLALTLKL